MSGFKKIQQITIIVLIVMILGCHPEKDIIIKTEESLRDDPFPGHYFNSSRDHHIKGLNIVSDASGYTVEFQYTVEDIKYRGRLQDSEIVVEAENQRAFHLYLHGDELRIYKVVNNGYQPEDIEWTFYRIR